MRILHAPINIANQAWATAQGLRAIGHHAEVWHFGPDPYNYACDRNVVIDDQPDRAITAFREALDKDFDVFHFHFARSLVPTVGGIPWFWDLPVLRALGKRIVFTFHGSDVRKKSVHLDEDPWSYFRFSDVDCDEPRIDKALAVIRTYSHALVVASPLNRTFVPEAEYVPKAIDVDAYGFVGARRDTRPLIVHAPSKRATKGTEFVVRGIEELRGRGIPFDFRVIERVPHDELRTIYEDADVVVDNVLLGDCEVSSLEAMTLGKVVVTRIREEVRTAHPDLPVVSADPNTLVDALLPLLSDAALRRRLGEESRAYVERNHAAHVVAQKLVPLYELAARPVWRVFPEWTGLATDRKLEAHEKRIQDLQVQIARLRRQLSDENSTLQDLRALYGSSRPIKFVREMRRYRARRG